MNKQIKLDWDTVQKGRIQAEDWRACKYHMQELKMIKTLEEFLAHGYTPYWLYWYAEQLDKGRIEAFEDIIATSPCCSYCYCKNIAGFRIPSMEDIIKDTCYWDDYLDVPEEVKQ